MAALLFFVGVAAASCATAGGSPKTDETQAVVLNQTTVFDWATMPLNLTKHGINKKTHLFCAPPPAGRCCRAFRRSCC